MAHDSLLYTVKVMPGKCSKGKVKAYTAAVSRISYGWLWLNWNTAQTGTC